MNNPRKTPANKPLSKAGGLKFGNFQDLRNHMSRQMEERTECLKCGAPITFKPVSEGKRAPFNEDGTIHWNTCPHSRSRKKDA